MRIIILHCVRRIVLCCKEKFVCRPGERSRRKFISHASMHQFISSVLMDRIIEANAAKIGATFRSMCPTCVYVCVRDADASTRKLYPVESARRSSTRPLVRRPPSGRRELARTMKCVHTIRFLFPLDFNSMHNNGEQAQTGVLVARRYRPVHGSRSECQAIHVRWNLYCLSDQ